MGGRANDDMGGTFCSKRDCPRPRAGLAPGRREERAESMGVAPLAPASVMPL